MKKPRKQRTFTDQIRRAILDAKRLGWSRYVLAREVGVSQGNLGDVVAGRSGISSPTLDRLAEVLRLKLVVDTQPRPPKKARMAKKEAARGK